MVVIHSEGILVWLALLVAVAAVLLFLISAILVVHSNFRLAKRIAISTLCGLVVWVVLANAISLLTPRTIVNVGETYCWDNLCLTIDGITRKVHPSETDYRLNIHIYSDANTLKINLKNIFPYLVDERGRRFPLVKGASSGPYDSLLDPGQSVNTTLTFEVAPDVRQLFLTGDVTGPTSVGGKKAPFWAPAVGWIMYGGGGFLLQKETLLRVL
jgi:hypothetical protein